MSKPYEEHLGRCDRCGEEFEPIYLIEEDDFIYCKPCYEILLEKGDI